MVDRVRAGRVREGALVQIDDGEGGSVGGERGEGGGGGGGLKSLSMTANLSRQGATRYCRGRGRGLNRGPGPEKSSGVPTRTTTALRLRCWRGEQNHSGWGL